MIATAPSVVTVNAVLIVDDTLVLDGDRQLRRRRGEGVRLLVGSLMAARAVGRRVEPPVRVAIEPVESGVLFGCRPPTAQLR